MNLGFLFLAQHTFSPQSDCLSGSAVLTLLLRAHYHALAAGAHLGPALGLPASRLSCCFILTAQVDGTLDFRHEPEY